MQKRQFIVNFNQNPLTPSLDLKETKKGREIEYFYSPFMDAFLLPTVELNQQQ